MSDKVSSSSSSGGIGFVGLLTILFIALKLTGYIHWSWIWVLSPLWIAPLVVIAILLVVLGGVGVFALGAFLLKEYDDRKQLNERRERDRLAAAKAVPVNAATKVTEKKD